MDAVEFRRTFAAFAGPERYLKFLRALNDGDRWRGRFLFWQEVLLERFAAFAGVGDLSFERVEPLFRVCELHDAELVPDPKALPRRCGGWANAYTRAQAERFPNIDCGPLVMGNRTGLWYCPACRDAREEWLASAPQWRTPTGNKSETDDSDCFVAWPFPVRKLESEWDEFDRDFLDFMRVAFAEGYRPRHKTCSQVEADNPAGRSAFLVFRGRFNGWEPCLSALGQGVCLGPHFGLGESACVCVRPPFRAAAHLALEWLRGRSLESLLGDFVFVGGRPAGIELRPEAVAPTLVL